ncbi:MAG: hypothetical protein [Inoviridae sp.]|nr:MAG: hypothetical protein [Inoviridae sp.]
MYLTYRVICCIISLSGSPSSGLSFPSFGVGNRNLIPEGRPQDIYSPFYYIFWTCSLSTFYRKVHFVKNENKKKARY